MIEVETIHHTTAAGWRFDVHANGSIEVWRPTKAGTMRRMIAVGVPDEGDEWRTAVGYVLCAAYELNAYGDLKDFYRVRDAILGAK